MYKVVHFIISFDIEIFYSLIKVYCIGHSLSQLIIHSLGMYIVKYLHLWSNREFYSNIELEYYLYRIFIF